MYTATQQSYRKLLTMSCSQNHNDSWPITIILHWLIKLISVMATDIKHFFLLRMAVTAWYILSRQKNVNFNQAQLQKALATDRIKKSVE